MLASCRNINYYAIFIVYTSLTNVADGLIIQQGGWHATRGLKTHVLNYTGRRENGGLKIKSCRKRKKMNGPQECARRDRPISKQKSPKPATLYRFR